MSQQERISSLSYHSGFLQPSGLGLGFTEQLFHPEKSSLPGKHLVKSRPRPVYVFRGTLHSSLDYKVAPNMEVLHPVPFNPKGRRFLLQFPFCYFLVQVNLQRPFLIPLSLTSRKIPTNCRWRGRQPPCFRMEPKPSGTISGFLKRAGLW